MDLAFTQISEEEVHSCPAYIFTLSLTLAALIAEFLAAAVSYF